MFVPLNNASLIFVIGGWDANLDYVDVVEVGSQIQNIQDLLRKDPEINPLLFKLNEWIFSSAL